MDGNDLQLFPTIIFDVAIKSWQPLIKGPADFTTPILQTDKLTK